MGFWAVTCSAVGRDGRSHPDGSDLQRGEHSTVCCRSAVCSSWPHLCRQGTQVLAGLSYKVKFVLINVLQGYNQPLRIRFDCHWLPVNVHRQARHNDRPGACMHYQLKQHGIMCITLTLYSVNVKAQVHMKGMYAHVRCSGHSQSMA